MISVYFMYVGFMFFNERVETWATRLNCCFNERTIVDTEENSIELERSGA